MIIANNSNLFCFRCYHTWKKRIKSRVTKYCPKCKSPYWNRPRSRVSREFIKQMEETITHLHDAIIKLSGGENGIRDSSGIYNSVYKLLNHQNKNTKNPISIGAFAINEFAKRHFFIDGNKRTAYAIAKIFMLINKCHLKTQYKEATDFMLEVAKYQSKVSFEDIKRWLDNNCTYIEEGQIKNYLNERFVKVTLGDDENERE
ncbi:MAG: type II toxin-antitoxin system death-on-curing family toxin [Nanoarchaeota archaeon]